MEKTKTVNINEDLHKTIKIYCAENDLKINDWISKVLLESIESKKK